MVGGPGSSLKCWRDASIVRTLLDIRLVTVKVELRRAQRHLNWVLSSRSATGPRGTSSRLRDLVSEIQAKKWKVENTTKQKKVTNLVERSKLCVGHKRCREMDRLLTARTQGWTPLGPPECRETLQPDPSQFNQLDVRSTFKTRSDDLLELDQEEQMVLQWSEWYNSEVTRKSKLDPSEDLVTNEVVVIGQVDLTEEELSLLNKGPDFMVVSPLDLTEMKVEMSVTLTKIRWGMWSKDQQNMSSPEILRQEAEETGEEQLERDKLEAEMRDVVGSSGMEIDMGRLRATDMKNNRNVYMPRPAGPRAEAELATRHDLWLRSCLNFKNNKCNKDGSQHDSNITPGEQLALKSLTKKVVEKKIVVMQADKGKMLVVVDTDTYQRMSEDHVDPADLIGPDQLRQSERILSAQAKALTNTLGVGRLQSQKNFARCYDNVASSAEDAATLKLLPKTHKPLRPQGYPQSRPVVAAASGMSSRAGDLVSEFLDPLVYLTTPRFEDRSTEEVLSQLEEAQSQIRQDKETDVMVASLDVKALYPSLHQEQSAIIVGDFVEKSKVDLQGINWDMAQLMVASNWTEKRIKKEGMQSYIPRRTKI